MHFFVLQIFLPKNTTAKLQPMDQGIIATLKEIYNKHMLNMARIKAAQGVQQIIKDIKIFDMIITAKVAWEAIDPETIQKCFKQCGVNQDLTMSPSPEPDDEDPEFAAYFQELLDISLG